MAEDVKSESARRKKTYPAEKPLSSGDKIELLSGLLDYYASRATSFASLFIAALFGLVAVATIIKGIRLDNYGIFGYGLSFIPYFAFVGLTWTTWQRFQYWKDISDKIERDGLRWPKKHKDFLKTIPVFKTNLYDYIDEKFQAADSEFWRSHTINRLGAIFAVSMIFLTLIVYWDFFLELLRILAILPR